MPDDRSLLQYLLVLVLYAALVATMLPHTRAVPPEERRTYLVLGLAWGGSVFIANWLLYLVGLLSFLPPLNNVLHAIVWIGGCLGFLYLGVRHRCSLPLQFVLFATYSLIVKYGEQLALGTWEHDHFFWIFRGNFAFVLGWSLLDGFYPLISLYGLRLVGRKVPGLVLI